MIEPDRLRGYADYLELVGRSSSGRWWVAPVVLVLLVVALVELVAKVRGS